MKKWLASLAIVVAGAIGLMSARKPPAPPLVLNTPFPEGVVGELYEWPLYRGGRGPYKCSITSGVLPPGLFLDKSCYIAGIPTTASTNGVVVVRGKYNKYDGFAGLDGQ